MRYLLQQWRNSFARGRVVVRRWTNSDRLEPAFFIIGAQKSGTTTLFAHLCQHPRIAAPIVKEIHYYEDPRNYVRGIDWYRSHFPARGDSVTGEATPSYYHPLVPARVAADFPDARLILLARNPVDRAYSHYQRQVRRGTETLSFEDALEQEEERIGGDLRRLADDPLWPALSLRTHAYQLQGFYLDHVNRWLDHFARDRLLVVPSEAYFDDPAATASRIFRFLELEDLRIELPEIRNQWRYDSSIDPDTRERLRLTFSEANRAFIDFAGLDCAWE